MGLTKPRAAQIFNLDYKQSTRVVTATDITLTGGAPNSVDGVTLSLNDRVLVTGQTTASQNGLYLVTTLGSGSNGTWARTSDGNENGEIEAGMIVMVTEGAIYADTQWKLITDDPITINTTALTFTQNYMANSISSGSSNVVVYSNANVTISSAGTANMLVVNNAGTVTAGTARATGNITGGNILTDGLISATGNISGNYILGNGSQLTGLPATYTNANVVSLLASFGSNIISTTGNVTADYFLGNVACASGIFSSRIFNGNSEVNIGAGDGNVNIGVGGTSNVAVFSTTGQFITGLLSVTGNVTSGNISSTDYTGTNVSVTGAVTTASTVGGIITGSSASVTGNITGGNLNTSGNVSAIGNIAGNYLLANIYFATGFSASRIFNGTSEANIGTSSGNANISIGGVSNVVVFSTTGQFITGDLGVTGNVTSGNISATNYTGTNVSVTGTITAASTVGGVITGTSTSVTGTQTAASTVGGVITGTSVNVTDGVTAASVAGGVITGSSSSVTGTVSGASASVSGGVTAASVAGGVITGTSISVSGTVTAASTVGGVITGSSSSVTGNVTGANLVVTTNIYDDTTLNIVTGAGDINLQPAGNVVVNSKNINGLAQPVQNQDAATKLYVDNAVSTAISYHEAVVAATTTTLATTTGGTVTYNQPNGAANGVGAILTTTGSFDLIDTANVQTVNTRILVKDEANATFNGVYTWSNATVITRALNEDTYGTGTAFALGLNDYFFVTSGNVNAGSAWIVDAPTDAITFGTSNIQFAQFSQSQVYSANTQAGISLSGTVINAKVDGTTTAFDGGGNISVKPGANLTTPNIGAATGTSLSVTGAVTATSTVGGVITGTDISVTGNTTTGNILTGGIISATGNITCGNILGNGAGLTGINAFSNVTVTGGNSAVADSISDTLTLTAGSGISLIMNATTDTLTIAALGSGESIFSTGGQMGVVYETVVNSEDLGLVTEAVTDEYDLATLFLDGFVGNPNFLPNSIDGNILVADAVISTTGNITGAYFFGNGSALTGVVAGAPNAIVNGTTNISTTTNGNANITIGGTSNVAVFSTTGVAVSGTTITTGNVTGGNLVTAGNVTGGNLVTAGRVTATGNITGNFIFGNGSQLTGIDATGIQSGTSNVRVVSSGSNVTTSISGTSNVVVVATTGQFVTGLISATGNVTGGNLVTAGNATISTSLAVGATTPSGTAGEIRATNAITAFYSDLRLKTNVQQITNALDKVEQLSGIVYTQNKLAETFGYTDYSQQVGVFAQDVKKVQPEAVKLAPFDLDENGQSKSGENYLTVQYEKLVPLLIESVKELRKEISLIKKQLDSKDNNDANNS
jgi:hypothetical protein